MFPQLQIQQPDLGRALAQGHAIQGNRLQMLAQQRELDDQTGIRAALTEAGPGALEGDGSLLARLAGYGPRGIQLAQTIQQRGDQQRGQTREQLPLLAGMLDGVTPENYPEVRARALAAGLSPSILPEQFDPNRVAGLQRAASTLRDARAADAAASFNATLPGRMAVAQAGRTSVNVRLPPMENSFAQRTGTDLAEEAGQLGAAGRRSAETLRMVDRFEQGLQNFDTGAAAAARLTVGQVAQQLGIPDSVLPRGLNRDAVASAEDMRALTSQMLAGMIGPGGFPAQNFSNADREMLERALPNIANTPGGNQILLQAARAGAQRNLEVAQAWRQWQQQNGVTADSYLRFTRERLPQITERDVLTPLMANRPQQQGAPGSVAIPGANGLRASPPTAPGVTHRFNPATGRIEPVR
jgi:hypothetical protein